MNLKQGEVKMKKLLVLSLVLSVASLATAGLSLSAAGDTATVVSDDDQAYVAFVAYTDGLPGAVALTPAGAQNLSYLNDYGVNPGYYFGIADPLVQVYGFSVASSTVGAVQSGDHLTATFAGLELGAVDQGLGSVYLLAEDSVTILGTAYVTPEPATMGLLGLGALLLRRKK
jgi:hypothetical protein